MSRDAFLSAIQASPDDDELRLVFADWLEEQGEWTAAARLRWYAGVRPKLRDEIRLEGEGRFQEAHEALVQADDWRWRLGCLWAVSTAEQTLTPSETAAWPTEWSANRFRATLEGCRFAIEAVALRVLPESELEEAKQIAEDARGVAAELADIARAGLGHAIGMLRYIDAIVFLNMAVRTSAIARQWEGWQETLEQENGIVVELMQASQSAFEILLAHPFPASPVGR